MRIAFVAIARMPTERAHGYQMMRVASELKKLGHEVSLYVPTRRNHLTQDAFSYYGLPATFPVVYVSCTDYLRFVRFLGPLAFILTLRSFLRNLFLPKDVLVYTRDTQLVSLLSKKGYRCIYNAHAWEERNTKRVMGAKGVVCNSVGTAQALKRSLTLPTAVAPNGADANPYSAIEKETLRRELTLPLKNIALYSGHLYAWKGSATLLETARLLKDTQLVCIGGAPEDVVRLKKESDRIPNVHFLGHQPRTAVPKFLAAADVLLLPNTSVTKESVVFTSPIKLFEYLAAGRPIIASDLPSIRSIVDETTVFFVPPENPTALAETITYALQHKEEAQKKAARALHVSANYTWEAHAKTLERFFSSLVG